jgi:hypothetical protein
VHCFNGCVGREIEAGPASHLARLRGGVGSTFSREQCIRPTLLGQRERLPRMGTTHRKHMSDLRGLAREVYVSCVSCFPCKVFNDLDRCDSWI